MLCSQVQQKSAHFPNAEKVLNLDHARKKVFSVRDTVCELSQYVSKKAVISFLTHESITSAAAAAVLESPSRGQGSTNRPLEKEAATTNNKFAELTKMSASTKGHSDVPASSHAQTKFLALTSAQIAEIANELRPSVIQWLANFDCPEGWGAKKKHIQIQKRVFVFLTQFAEAGKRHRRQQWKFDINVAQSATAKKRKGK